MRRSGSYSSPGCLDGGANCPSAWPKVLWEIQDASDADSNGYPDMGESWSKPGLGRICVAKDDSGNCTDERYVALFGGGFDRERKNRRGNWFYIVDVETGFVLYKVRSGIANFGSGNVAVNFASIPSEPSAIDLNNDGLLDFAYFGDLLGQMWRLDLRDIKISVECSDRPLVLQASERGRQRPVPDAPLPGSPAGRRLDAVLPDLLPAVGRLPRVDFDGTADTRNRVRHGRSRRRHRDLRPFDAFDLVQPALLLRDRQGEHADGHRKHLGHAPDRELLGGQCHDKPRRQGGTCCWGPRTRRSASA